MLVEDDKITFRTVTIGDSSVGKTSIVNKFVRNRFNPDEPNTIGALYDSFQEVRDGHQIEIQIWDTAGQEQYRALSPVYFRSAAAAVIVFDVTNTESFNNVGGWLTSFREVSTDKAVIVIVGNKVDLEANRKVTREEAEDFAKRNDCEYAETSASTGVGVHELFKFKLVDLLVKRNLEEMSSIEHQAPIGKDLKANNDQKQSCSC